MAQLTASEIASIVEHRFWKEFPDLEYETKLEVSPHTGDPDSFISQVADSCRNGQAIKGQEIQRYTPVLLDSHDHFHAAIDFYFSGPVEYSFFSFHGAKMMKTKIHHLLPTTWPPMFRNEEYLTVDTQDFHTILIPHHYRFRNRPYALADIGEKLHEVSHASHRIGTITKDRLKCFVYDHSDSRLYAIALTICTSGNDHSKKAVQRQLEVEYAGILHPTFSSHLHKVSPHTHTSHPHHNLHIEPAPHPHPISNSHLSQNPFLHSDWENEVQVIKGVGDLTHYFSRQFPDHLHPTTERKRDFAHEHSSRGETPCLPPSLSPAPTELERQP